MQEIMIAIVLGIAVGCSDLLNYNVKKKEYFICAVMYRNTQMKSRKTGQQHFSLLHIMSYYTLSVYSRFLDA